MPMLLEDLADETTASLRRAADRMAAEARALGGNDHPPEERAALRAKAATAARQATAYAVARLPQAEAVWESGFISMADVPAADVVALLRSMLGVFEGGRQLCRLTRELWARAAALGATPDPLDDLTRVLGQFARLASRTRKAIDHRENGWRPADPERYAREMQQAREGPFVSAEELIRRFRGN